MEIKMELNFEELKKEIESSIKDHVTEIGEPIKKIIENYFNKTPMPDFLINEVLMNFFINALSSTMVNAQTDGIGILPPNEVFEKIVAHLKICYEAKLKTSTH